MYQGWKSDTREVECYCGQPRKIREEYLGYSLSFVFVDSEKCPMCENYYRPGDLIAWTQCIIERRKTMGSDELYALEWYDEENNKWVTHISHQSRKIVFSEFKNVSKLLEWRLATYRLDIQLPLKSLREKTVV